MPHLYFNPAGFYSLSSQPTVMLCADRVRPTDPDFRGRLRYSEAGFALVRKNERDRFEIAEFCVLAAFRRMGAGSAAAAAIFSAHPGEWEVQGFPGNAAAAAFWKRAITACAGDARRTVENGVWGFEVTAVAPFVS
jgi:ribosomal protein S18 acetylase RimI-like enzyme